MKLQKPAVNTEEFIPFKDMLTDAINNVKSTQSTADKDMLKLASGQTDDLHSVMINSAKADLAIQTLVQVRNKAVEAYNEIMRINL
jgi:flagellar hook-basal body complex protein FliE